MDHQRCERRRNYRGGGGGLQVTAIAPGEALITVKTEDGGKTASCTVTVKEKIIPVESISLNQTTLSLKIGEKETLQAMVSPENATNKNISWSSDKTDVATVDGNGNVSANSVGTATITAKAGEQSATCTVTVSKIPVSSITINGAEPTLVEGDTLILTATITPSDASYKTVTWTSSNGTVAIVDQNGKVTAKSVGTATITATADGETAECTITVEEKVIAVDSITLDPTTGTLLIGDTLTITATVTPDTATDKSITWTSDNEVVATVDSNGKVTAESVGTATITATAGDKSATCTITVKPIIAVTKVSITPPDSTKIKYGEAIDLVATVEPEGATNKNVTWTSSDTTVATVDQNGRVAAQNKAGTATITVTTEDGGKTATCDITVEERSDVIPVINITLNETNKTINKENSYQLTATFNPTNATNKIVNWSSSDPEVATVDGEGNVRAVGGGTATITAASAENAEIKATCEVTVYVPVTDVKLNKTKLRLASGTSYQLIATVEPEDATDNIVTWGTSNTGVIKNLDQNGRFTAGTVGEAFVRVYTIGDEFNATCNVTVYTPVESVSIDNPPTELAVGKDNAITLTASINPYWADYKDVSWSSNKPDIISVDSSTGRIEAHKEGEATITVTTEDGKKTASCTIKAIIPVESVTIVNAPLEMAEGDTITLEADVLPEYATNKTVTWSSSNSEVATIDEETGFLKALKPGTVDITVKAGNGKSQMNRITIEEALVPVESITLDKANGEILVGKTLSLNATVLPDDANKKVTWSSDNEAVATVYQNGTVTGVSAGKATITATAVGGLTAQCNITVVTETDGALTYSFSPYDKTAYVENCDNSKIGSDGSVVIPDEYAGYKITEIGYKAFENCTNLKSVAIGQNVGTIRGNAFYGCTGLTSITIPGNVEIVDSNAFEGCSGLTSVTLEEGIRQIYGYVFSDCTRLSEIKIPDTVTTIGLGAFYNCTSLSTVTIGSGVTSIEDNTFYKCPITSLTNRSTVTPKIEYIRAIYDKDENKESPTIGGIYTSIGEGAFMGTGVKTVVIPANITSIGYQAFDSCDGLAEITIPGTVKRIERGAFYNCTSLSKVTINSGVEYIEETAFSGCPITDLDNYSGLSFNVAYTSAMYKGEPNPVIEDFYTIIDNNAFQGREELQSITIPDNIEMIGGYAFEGCSNLSTVNFGPGSKLTRIGVNAFQNCTGLTSITLPNSVTTIDAAAFSSSGLTSISIPDSVFRIDNQTFMGCTALGSVSIGTGVKTIGSDAFNGCTSLTSVEIPDNVTDIYDSVFEGCSGLTSVTIGEGITSIGQYAFRGCTSVTEYVFRGNTPPELRYEALSGLGEFDIFVPNEAVAAYEKDWPEYVGQIKTR